MPRLNRRGEWCAGIGSNTVSAQSYGVLATSAGAADWVDETTVVCSRRINLNPELWTVSEFRPAGTDRHDGGAQWIEAGGGIWAAGIGGTSPRVWTSDGRSFLGAAVLAVGRDGSILLKPDYGATVGARWITSSRTIELAGLGPRSPHIAPDGIGFVYATDTGTIKAYGLPDPIQTPGIGFQPRCVLLPNGERWLLVVRTEHGRERLLLHPWNSPMGYVLAEATENLPTYRPDAVALDNGHIRYVYAGNAAETPGSIAVKDADLSAPRVDLSAPFTAPIVSIGRPCGLAFFNFQPHTTPGNWTLNVPELIVRDSHGLSVGQFVEGKPDGDLAAINASIAAAKSTGLQIIAYWPKSLQAGPLPIGADFVGVEAYCFTDSLPTFEARVRAAVKRCPRVMLVCQCYTNNAPTADLASLVPIYGRIAKDCPNVVGLLVFSGYGRATGLQDHPEVLPLWQQLAAGIPSAPIFPSEEFVHPPIVTVTKFDGHLHDKWHLTTKDDGNPDAKLVVDTWTEQGSDGHLYMYQAISHSGGSARTAAKREVA